MLDLDFLSQKLQSAPAGFGFVDTGQWLQDIPFIEQLADLMPLLHRELSRKEWLALMVIFKQRYLKDGPAHNLFNDHFEHYIQEHTPQDYYKQLSFYEDHSQCLDFSCLTKQLTKLIISASRKLETIILPTSDKLEALELSYLPELDCLQEIEQVKQLSYLTINHCPNLQSFSFIKQLKKLVWLDLSGNQQLTDLSFLSNHSQLVILHLLDTSLLDNPDVTKQLMQLVSLNYLTIAGTQGQVMAVRQQLPHCVVNGMSALTHKV